ncbi:hypothetical protein [Desulfovibrio inopinatus]|uniref:hypothetical protein n=1 Tax=Desulfovibrio inopinatus TaxID=102109 RepID=UPI00041372A6|nr:hypothetical protein [Desulfovibrio inopinatus]
MSAGRAPTLAERKKELIAQSDLLRMTMRMEAYRMRKNVNSVSHDVSQGMAAMAWIESLIGLYRRLRRRTS